MSKTIAISSPVADRVRSKIREEPTITTITRQSKMLDDCLFYLLEISAKINKIIFGKIMCMTKQHPTVINDSSV